MELVGPGAQEGTGWGCGAGKGAPATWWRQALRPSSCPAGVMSCTCTDPGPDAGHSSSLFPPPGPHGAPRSAPGRSSTCSALGMLRRGARAQAAPEAFAFFTALPFSLPPSTSSPSSSSSLTSAAAAPPSSSSPSRLRFSPPAAAASSCSSTGTVARAAGFVVKTSKRSSSMFFCLASNSGSETGPGLCDTTRPGAAERELRAPDRLQRWRATEKAETRRGTWGHYAH